MLSREYLVSAGLLIIAGIVYQKFKIYAGLMPVDGSYAAVEKYLLNKTDSVSVLRPFLWMHVEGNYNARCWKSWGSRSSRDVNQPYIGLTVASVVEKCGDTFNICVIGDNSFSDLLPNWSIDLSRVAEPVKTKLRNVAMAQILYQYGGLTIPASFLCMRSLRYVYDSIVFNKQAFVGQLRRNGTQVAASARFMGCLKGSRIVRDYINYLQIVASTDYTEASNFAAEDNVWLETQIANGMLGEIDAKHLGVEDDSGDVVTIERLMNPAYVEFTKGCLGIEFPQQELLERKEYGWFNMLTPLNATLSDTTLGKLLLVSLPME